MIWNIIINGIVFSIVYNIVKYYINPKYYIVKVVEDKEKEYYVIKRKTSIFDRISPSGSEPYYRSVDYWGNDISFAKKFTSSDNTIPGNAIIILNQLRRKGIETKRINI